MFRNKSQLPMHESGAFDLCLPIQRYKKTEQLLSSAFINGKNKEVIIVLKDCFGRKPLGYVVVFYIV